MILDQKAFNELLPPFLHDSTKGRIRAALDQFSRQDTIDYSNFYTLQHTGSLLQSDVLSSVKSILWDEVSGNVENGYNPAMLMSNSCDVTAENIRSINQKDALFAPIIPVEEYIKDCKEEGFNNDQISTFLTILRKQEYTNLFYLPPNLINKKDFFVRLDRIYWLPTSQLQKTIEAINETRFISLSQWAWYLFIVKLSLHTCRTPEEVERPQSI